LQIEDLDGGLENQIANLIERNSLEVSVNEHEDSSEGNLPAEDRPDQQ
jgi:hypothetical protein